MEPVYIKVTVAGHPGKVKRKDMDTLMAIVQLDLEEEAEG